ncbi:hypothetical protein COL26b_001992 [Colletotrichum chrysophilum]|uniref:uncharacterized protein n=1 Tax=Colletotrichum chrysophilum TaxID=1836956 RepID=UPI002301794F|nr:uncharacterized protein COL26b_001992 [Colletotrichum chrysophilum]KAJ0379839.1 hypothetical protein COL26b_001992 [Colletotrichum chrysophilum]
MSEPESFDHGNGGQVLDIPMFQRGSEGSGFHIKNNPEDSYQRPEVIQRAGAVATRCTLIDAVHGAMSAESKYWSTILVFEFRFDPQKKARRISRATIELRFDGSSTTNSVPEVEAISFDGNYSFRPSKQSETTTKGFETSLGASAVVEASTSIKWEKTITRETADATTITGGKTVMNNMPPNRIAKWTLLENSTFETGVPAAIRVAVRIKRSDEECKADMWTSLENVFSRIPEDDPIFLKPGLNTRHGPMHYDMEELGSVDIQKLGDVKFSQMMLDD